MSLTLPPSYRSSILFALLISATVSHETQTFFRVLHPTNLPTAEDLMVMVPLFLMFGHLVCKDEPPAEIATIGDFLPGLFSNKARHNRTFLGHIMKCFDDIVIGYAGKKRGVVPVGSKIIIQGNPRFIASHVYPKEGERIEFYARDHFPAYGIMGILWAYLKPILTEIKTLGEGLKSVEYLGCDVGFEFEKI